MLALLRSCNDYHNFPFRFLLFVRSKCRERDSNPHSHYWPRDFKSLVSTNSTIAATYASTFEVLIKNGSISATFPNKTIKLNKP